MKYECPNCSGDEFIQSTHEMKLCCKCHQKWDKIQLEKFVCMKALKGNRHSDPYLIIATLIYNCLPSEVNDGMREEAKNKLFQLLYTL